MNVATLPDDRTVTTALALAGRAPSLDDVQPWRWRATDRGIDLLVEPEHSAADRESREAVISCGIALRHLCVAFAASGWAAVVHRAPDPVDPNHLASVRWVPHRVTRHEAALRDAIMARRTDHRPSVCRPIPPGHLSLFAERASGLGAQLRRVSEAAQHRIAVAVAGGEEPAPTAPRDHAELFVCGTLGDDRLAWLRAGEAVGAVLLTATNIGLDTSLLSLPTGPRRHAIRTEVFDGIVVPQVLLRVGWAPDDGEPLPAR